MTVCVYRYIYIHATTLHYVGINKGIVCVWEYVGEESICTYMGRSSCSVEATA